MTNEWGSTNDECTCANDLSFGLRQSDFVRISSFVRQICRDGCSDEDVHEGDLKKEEPAEAHQLVITKTRQRPAHPHEYENERCDFGEKGRDVEQPPDYAAPARRASIDNGPVKSAMPCF